MKLATNDLSTYRSEIMGLACLYVIFTHNFFNWPDRLISLRRFANCGNIAVEFFDSVRYRPVLFFSAE